MATLYLKTAKRTTSTQTPFGTTIGVQTNGAIGIADLIDPDDANRDLFTSAHEMTDHGSTGWPTIIAYSTSDFAPETLLILEPVLKR